MTLLLMMAASALAPSCDDVVQCFESARAVVGQAVTVLYQDGEGVEDKAVVERCRGGLSSCVAEGPARDFGNRKTWYTSTVAGQGFRVSAGQLQFDGYRALPGGTTLPIDRTDPRPGYTLAITFNWRQSYLDPGLVSITDAGGNLVYKISFDRSWYRGADRLSITRWATTERGAVRLQSDRPWDFDSDILQNGPAEFPGHPTPQGLYELYLTFRTDGKVELDLFSVSDTTRDFMISHLQDTGWPVEAYPTQPSSGSWEAPVYRGAQSLRVDASSNWAVLQMVKFDRALTRAERIGFHARNLFYGATFKTGTASIRVTQVPCNSGEFMNLSRKDILHTVCGDRAGVLTTDATNPAGEASPD